MTFHTKRSSPGRGVLMKRRANPGRGAFVPRRIKSGGLVMVSTRLTVDDAEAFANAAEARGVPLARVIREALREYLDRTPRSEVP